MRPNYRALPPQSVPEKAPPTNTMEGQPPRTLRDIPGLGPIRVRALQKAGFETIHSLRGATLEQLETVSGITSVKAAAIQQFLAQFPPVPEQEQAPPEKIGRRSPPSLSNIDTLLLPALKAQSTLIALLLNSPEEGFRARLRRELEHLAHSIHALTLSGRSVQDSAAGKLLSEIEEELKSGAAGEPMGRKEQARLAESLAGIHVRMQALTGDSEEKAG